ncbi:MAG: chemotaxis protein CheW [Clostridiaceae bacterium]|nr:chemotaxis protein CheW [Clostridiaceae bacterium]
MGAEKKQFVVFRLDNEEYGADINKVTIIERPMNITRVPMTPHYIKGVINLRGDIIPVMSLRLRLGLDEIDEDENTRIIIFNINGISFGAIVDSVSEVLQFDDSQIEGVSSIISDKALDYISGVAKAKDKLVTLLNLEKLIAELIPA